MAIILASGSPRRKQLLEMLGLEFQVIPAKGEEVIPHGAGPDEAVQALSAQKAASVAAERPAEDVIIAADTIVWYNGAILGKPRDEQEAARMLSSLSGNTHTVYTGVTVRKGDTVVTGAEETQVRFRKLSGREIDAYIATGEPMDKAGSYGIQGYGAMFVSHLEGDYFSVMGLPLCPLCRMLRAFGVHILTEKEAQEA